MQGIFIDQSDKLLRILRISSITRLSKAMGPALIIREFKIKEESVSVPISQKIGMVPERLFRRVVLSETFPFCIIIVIYLLSCPGIVAFYTEMIISLDS